MRYLQHHNVHSEYYIAEHKKESNHKVAFFLQLMVFFINVYFINMATVLLLLRAVFKTFVSQANCLKNCIEWIYYMVIPLQINNYGDEYNNYNY